MIQGIDRVSQYAGWFKNKRLGLITGPSGLNQPFHSTIDVLYRDFKLTALFSPEHGVRGDIGPGEMVANYRDEATGLPVYSLYQKDSKRLTDEMLDQVDAVVYDIQDVGTRYFTFIYTMLYALEDCAAHGKTFIVLDRANPLGGDVVEGNILRDMYSSFVGAYPLCNRYALTIGEFAGMANAQKRIGCDLRVVPCEGWNRASLFCDYNDPWIPPSLGLPSFEAAMLYPGTCLFEGTNISEGRGTSLPFQAIGAPFLRARELADAMNAKQIAGVVFLPVYFHPTTSKFNGEDCQGVQIHVTDYRRFRAVDVGVELLYEIRKYEEFAFLPPYKPGSRQFIELLTGDDRVMHVSYDAQEILAGYHADSRQFAEEKREFHLYP